MFEKLGLTQMAQSMASHAGARMGVIAQNVAHADTPRYRAQDIGSFAQIYEGLHQMRATREGHFQNGLGAEAKPFISDGPFAPNGNSVSLEQEMVKGAQARQDHEMALTIYRATSNVLRSALGRA